MAPSPPPALPERELPVHTPPAQYVDIVWGAPSDEMLEAEARGDIILIEDIGQRSTPPAGKKPEASGN